MQRGSTPPPSVLSRLVRNHRKNLKVAAEILLKGQNETGGWRYTSTSVDAISVTQFAVLALRFWRGEIRD